jgi:hypothetical protein
MWKRASKGEIEPLSEERKALAERYTIDAAEAQKREQLAAELAAREAEQQEHSPVSAKPEREVVTEPDNLAPRSDSPEASTAPDKSPRLDSYRYALSSVRSRYLMLLGFTAVAAASYSTNWHSPVRVAVTVVFLLFLPGLALAELAPLTQPVERLVVAIGVSLALETLLAVAFLYAGLFTPGRVFAVVLVATAAFTAVVAFRARQPS